MSGDDQHDNMVERIDLGEECPHCHGGGMIGSIKRTKDLSGRTLFVCGCTAQWLSYTDVVRPREAA